MRLIAAAVAILSSSLALAQTGGEPIKIAASFDLSGPAASYGQMAQNGAQFAVEVLNKRGGVLGHPVVLNIQDNGTNPQRAVSQATAMVRDGAVFLIAPQISASTLAVSKTVSAKMKVPMCVSVSRTVDTTMKDFQPYIFSVVPNQYMALRAVAIRVAKQGHKRVALISNDSAGGRSSVEQLIGFLKEENPQIQVVAEEYTPLGLQDFTATLNKVAAAKPDWVFSGHFGSDVITLSKQGKAMGFFKPGQFFTLYDSETLKSLGADAVLGSEGYAAAPMNYMTKMGPESRDFVERYKARYGQYPGDDASMTYDCVMTWAQATTMAKSTKADDVMKSIVSNEFDSTRGKFRFGKIDHMGEVPTFIGKVVDSKEFAQPVLEVEEAIPGSLSRAPDAVILKSRQQ
ncbi:MULTISPECIES: ABC transporter substrate-binding protein [Paraburkholderia]|nr:MULTISPECIES: ABC transporter substrate-binding protein [Paraburkholderia]